MTSRFRLKRFLLLKDDDESIADGDGARERSLLAVAERDGAAGAGMGVGRRKTGETAMIGDGGCDAFCSSSYRSLNVRKGYCIVGLVSVAKLVVKGYWSVPSFAATDRVLSTFSLVRMRFAGYRVLFVAERVRVRCLGI